MSELSQCEEFWNLPELERAKRLARLSDAECEALWYDYHFKARPKQMLPPGLDWKFWLILAGRGFGKSWTGAQVVRNWAKSGQNKYVNLIGATASDVRDIMVDGESGILALCPKDERPEYKSSKSQLVWPNGVISLCFSADEPERLRGKQHYKIWADELCAWRYDESWDQAMFGLRLGVSPQVVITTTPKPTKLIKEIKKDHLTVITVGSTYENKSNLAPSFLSQIVAKYEGTRLGRQELHAEILDDNPGALWQRSNLDENRLQKKVLSELKRIVVAVDPAVTSDEDSDETGLVVAGLGIDSRGYVLEDASMKDTPLKWAAKAVELYKTWQADRVVVETNQGGEMIATLIRQIDANIPIQEVHASKGKFSRAEPVSALYEQGRVSHVGSHPKLEDQMCDYDPASAKRSPDRMDALVWALTALMLENNNIGVFDFYAQEALKLIEKNPALLAQHQAREEKIKQIFWRKP